MKVKKYRVQLREEEQQELRAPVTKGRAAAYKQTQARILLLLSDEAQADGRHEGRCYSEGGHCEDRALPPWNGCAAAGWKKELRQRALGRKRATEPEAEAVGGSRRSPPRIQYGAGSDCLGLG